MGSRRLREWILRPLVHVEPIQDRLDAVEELAFSARQRGTLRDALGQVQDLDRILGRVTLGTASPRDLVALARSLEALPAAKLEPSLAGANAGETFQFERHGYFTVDPDSTPAEPVFNRAVSLRDSWAKQEQKAGK